VKAPLPCLAIAVLALAGCDGGGTSEPAAPRPTEKRAEPAAADHGTVTDLGQLTVAGKSFALKRLGDLKPGVEGAIEVHPVRMPADEMARLNLYLWVEDEDRTQVSAPAKGTREGDALHFHVTPSKESKPPARVVLRLRMDGTDERAGLPLDGHGHEHVEGPHAGVPAAFSGGGRTGFLELKLHDDKGDLELWLTEDERFSRPFDLPLDSTIEVEFVDVKGRKTTLRPRNETRNEDEEGKPNVRDGKTNYFIYPSADGEDASWLQGKSFQSIVVVRFSRDGADYVSEEFVLKPHVH